jgi:deoxyribose-phosphate aldolase
MNRNDTTSAGPAIAPLIDHTILKPEARRADIERTCAEAVQFGFAAVCVYAAWVPLVAGRLRGTGVRTCTVAGFPHGAATTASKAFEAAEAVQSGADEVDMVLAVHAVRDGDLRRAEDDVRAVVKAAGGRTVKVILETGLLTDTEKVAACRLCVAAGAAFVKTSTGMGAGGATVADVRLMRATVGPGVGVKASGGIRTLADAMAMAEAGANRLGTSAGVAIMAEAATKQTTAPKWQ